MNFACQSASLRTSFNKIEPTIVHKATKTQPTFWNSIENQRNFLDDVAISLNIKQPQDWGKVTKKRFFQLRGQPVLQFYDYSLFSCLQSVYTGCIFQRRM